MVIEDNHTIKCYWNLFRFIKSSIHGDSLKKFDKFNEIGSFRLASESNVPKKTIKLYSYKLPVLVLFLVYFKQLNVA